MAGVSWCCFKPTLAPARGLLNQLPLSSAAAAVSHSGSAADAVGVAPDALEGQPPCMRGDELMDRIRTPGSWRIRANGRRRFQQRGRYLPQALDALGRREQRVIAPHRIENQPLIGLEYVSDQAGVVHRKLQTEFVEPHAGARTLGVKRQRHLRGIGQIESQMVRAQCPYARTGREHAL